MTRIKICCISSASEARLAIHHGASAIGLVSHMPSGPGVIPESRITKIAAAVPPTVATVLLTSRVTSSGIIAQQKRCRVNTLQLCDRVNPEVYADLRKALPGIALIQVIHITSEESVTEAVKASLQVDALLLDSGNQSLPVKVLGGTGQVHDWRWSTEIVKQSQVPVFLAGGLHSGNVGEAIRTVRPFGVDVCSGVRTADKLDEQKLTAFIRQVNRTA